MSLPINHEMLLSIREAAGYSNFCCAPKTPESIEIITFLC